MDNNLAQWIEKRLAKSLTMDHITGNYDRLVKLLKEINNKEGS